ncbi:AAA family ATPase [Streptomyces sp. RG80]|uniref:AAA family ATPase n=1 Tax=Streptomyces sp. RG80 TaxID=3157340 RepID=UPI00338E67A3
MEDALRSPRPLPWLPEPFVGRDGDVVQLADQLLALDAPQVIVLHGPAGVGKSALAAAVARRVGERDLPVHWITMTGACRVEDAERVLLRLLAERRAPRRAIVEAYVRGNRKPFNRELRRQCAEYTAGSVVVLDDAAAKVGRRVLDRFDLSRTRVLVTSRQRAAWEGSGARLHAVRPLGARKAARLAEAVAGSGGGTRPDSDLPALLSAVRGSPPLVRVVGAVAARIPGARVTGVHGAGGLLARVLEHVGTADILRRLSVRETPAPFTLRTLQALSGANSDLLRNTLELLAGYEIVTRVGEDRFTLAAPVAEAVRTGMPGHELRTLAEEVSRALYVAASADLWDTAIRLDGRPLPGPHPRVLSPLSPLELIPYADDFIDLLSRHPRPGDEWRQSIDALGLLLAVRGDTHRLVALHRDFPVAACHALSVALRQLGLPKPSLRLLRDEPNDARLTYAYADVAYLSGQLDIALMALADEPPAQAADNAWHAVVRGAALCDQGRPVEAKAELLRAGETHRQAGCTRGRGWALLHQARASLLMGEANGAQHLLSQAEAAFRSVGDARGRNWVATEQIRVGLLDRPSAEDELDTAQRALTAHEAMEDVRGMGWTCQYLALIHARHGRTRDAIVALRAAAHHFGDCADTLGAVWARHRLAVLGPPAYANAELIAAERQFKASDCPLGQAWSLLELALRVKPRTAIADFLTRAEHHFDELDDESGLLWTQIVGGVRSGVGLGLSMFPGDLPADLGGRARRLEDLAHFRSALTSGHLRDPLSGDWQAIPFRARDLVAVSARRRDRRTRSAAPTPHCQVRLTLLDDPRAVDSTARILLRVVPATGHPWLHPDGGPPWLTAVAIPLTPASLEPPTALLRPSELPVHGAEFDFTAHRPGVHVVRFTIALERTGTVLQQVETELEILDTDGTGAHAAPQTYAARQIVAGQRGR